VWNARVLLRELRERNYAGGYTILTDWLRPQRSATGVVAVRRFETAPGQQAQVDWGHLGTLEMAGQEQKLHGFTFTQGYSRRMVAEAALDQKLGTLPRLHEAAFQQIGGVLEEILYDRMRKHSVLTFPPHHQGIPLGARRAEGKILIHLRQSAPVVKKRSLAAYEHVANGGGDEHSDRTTAGRFERGSIILTSNKSYEPPQPNRDCNGHELWNNTFRIRCHRSKQPIGVAKCFQCGTSPSWNSFMLSMAALQAVLSGSLFLRSAD